MAQHDYVIANGTGAAVRSDLNNALAAIVSQNSGATEPATMYAYQWWADTSTGLLKLRNAANNAWITLRELDGTLTIEAGTVSAPGLAFASDLNTGIYSPSADQLAIATNGVERVEFGTSEVVFNDGGANYDFRIEGDTNSSLFFVDASAEAVGIGTTSPSSNLHVQTGNGVIATLNLNNGDGNGTISQINLGYTGAANHGNIRYDGSLIFSNAANTERFRCDSSGRLLVGTSTVPTVFGLNSDTAFYKASGNNVALCRSDSLGNGEVAAFAAGSGIRNATIAALKHSGITNPCAYLGLVREDSTNSFLWTDNSGNFRISSDSSHIGTTSGTVVGTQTSDERIKNVLGPVEYGLETLKQIEPVRFSLKSEPEVEKLGFIAQQVQPLVPQSVFNTGEHIEGEPEDAPTKLGMEYASLIPVLVNAVKELSAEVDALKAQLKAQ
jgi:hypothetical protein